MINAAVNDLKVARVMPFPVAVQDGDSPGAT
jgi:hypothetical protein